MPRRLSGLFAVPAILAALASPALAQNRPMTIAIDSATRVQLRAPAGSVIVANPQVADVAVVDANTLFITGKGYGSTDIVAVDALGRPLFQSQVTVNPPAGGSVRVWRGAEVAESACGGGQCAPSARRSVPSAD
ncbi:pilus assembly protein N-terminal domain-containing protein [Brevundimonas faecalis]|uniref:Flp pilus assembly secretin CpaC n=1 Tax=Brevundimonas faecalis TaxID=947378 RepID=A0ABV2RBK9_9CAUL